MHLSLPPFFGLTLLSVLRRWFCCCWFIVNCCSHCLWGFCIRFLFRYSVLCVHLLLQTSWWGIESWLLCLNCLPDVLWQCSVASRGWSVLECLKKPNATWDFPRGSEPSVPASLYPPRHQLSTQLRLWSDSGDSQTGLPLRSTRILLLWYYEMWDHQHRHGCFLIITVAFLNIILSATHITGQLSIHSTPML